MTPGERIALITESARLLAAREWEELNLILREHGFGTDFDAPQGPYTYAMNLVESGSDEALAALHAYLTGADGPDSADDRAWAQGQVRLFVSHLATHQEFIGQVAYALSTDGVSAFVAHTSIDPSEEWQGVIEGALRSCEAMVVFLHAGFHQSNWCDQEVGFALARRIPVLPIAIDSMPYGFMSKFQALRAAGVQPTELAGRITDWLVTTPTAQEAMTEGLVTALERSTSYDRTRRLVGLLQLMPRFTPDELVRLSQAASTNGQVKEANLNGVMVPSLIQALVAQRS